MDVVVNRVLLHGLRATLLLLLFFDHLAPLGCSLETELVEGLLVLAREYIEVKNLARVHHVWRLSSVRDGSRP